MAGRHPVTVIDPDKEAAAAPRATTSTGAGITIVEGLLEPGSDLSKQQAVVSTSVIEHIPAEQHSELVAAIHDVLAPGGYSIHAVDLTCRAVNGYFASQQDHCQAWCNAHGIDVDVAQLVRRMVEDVETFWLPVTIWQQGRKGRPYDRYPWRHVGTMNLVARRTS